MVEPILKWAGGKRQLLDEIYTIFPEDYDSYHEPMIGGGAVFFDLEESGGTIGDKNPRLINFYKQVKENPDKLISKLKSFSPPESDTDGGRRFSQTNRKGRDIKCYYYQQREIFNNRPNSDDYDEVTEAALLLYLNRTCYNGLYRENQSGEFNSPIGDYENPDWVREDAIRAASGVLDQTTIVCDDFDYVIEKVSAGDLVYFDPPYKPMSSTANFTEYSADGFDKEDQKRLLEFAKELDEMGVKVVISNSGVTYDFYNEAGFSVRHVEARRSINSDGENRDEVKEILATNT